MNIIYRKEENRMSQYILEKDNIRLIVNSKGAEMKSLQRKGVEYLWYADSAYWGRSAPVLFPIVGSLKNKEFTFQGKQYSMNQHGFARDMEFKLVNISNSNIRMRLQDSEDTKINYPFSFVLDIEYVITDDTVKVIWHVTNPDCTPLYFSIGGHPGFLCPIAEYGKQTDYSIQIGNKNKPVEALHSVIIGEKGLASEEEALIETKNGILNITEALFSKDALIFEKEQTDEISLLTPQKKAYLTVRFDAPVVGVWTPSMKQAPFICIEPWYGRCDGVNFNGNLENREWGNRLLPGEEFEHSYEITLSQVEFEG